MSDDAVKYLLGQSSDEERERIERAYFSGGAEFEEMLAAEDELFFDYAAGGLSAEQRGAFERRWLGSEDGRRRLAAAEAIFRAYQPEARAPQPTTAGSHGGGSLILWALATAAALLAAVSVWLVQDRNHARAELAIARSEIAQQRTAVAAATPSRPAPLVVAVALAPGLTRAAGERRRVRIPPDADSVRLDLDLAAATLGAGRRIVVRTADGDEIWSEALSGNTTAHGVSAQVPARLFATADYEIVVTAAPAQRPLSYSFTAVR